MTADPNLLNADEAAEFIGIETCDVFAAHSRGMLPDYEFVNDRAYWRLADLKRWDHKQRLPRRDWKPFSGTGKRSNDDA